MKLNAKQFVSAEVLLETLFDKRSRPSMKWLRLRQKSGQIPSVKIGRLVFFDPDHVKEELQLSQSRT
jgi:hypothetical protein